MLANQGSFIETRLNFFMRSCQKDDITNHNVLLIIFIDFTLFEKLLK